MGSMTIKSHEVRSMSEDGKSMTSEMTRNTVYDKA